MGSKQAKDVVKHNFEAIMSLAVMSTPVFLINQRWFVGGSRRRIPWSLGPLVPLAPPRPSLTQDQYGAAVHVSI